MISAPRTDPPAIRLECLRRPALSLTLVVCFTLASGCASNTRVPAPVDELSNGTRQERPSINWEPAPGTVDGARAENPSIIWEPSPGTGDSAPPERPTIIWDPPPGAADSAPPERPTIIWDPPPGAGDSAPPESPSVISEPSPKADSAAPNTAAPTAAESRQVNYRMAMAAKKMLGVPYRWGGTTPAGFDCSGLVYYAYRKVGLSPPRTTWDQYQRVKRVHPSDLRVGDLLFFRLSGRRVSHVAIYLGQNQFVHAPATGSQVSYARLTMPFWRQRLMRVGRLY